MSTLIIIVQISLVLLLTTVNIQGQLCTLQFLPALQIITMPESTRPGDLVARLQITGTSSEISTRLIYNSPDVKTNGTDYFTLNFTNLYLRSSLDYEWWTANGYPNPFRFIVACTILADQSVHDIDFQLDLLDVNDNAPTFNQSIYDLYLLETTSINSIVTTSISAYDLDSGVFGTFSYYLLNSSSSYISYFRLVSSTNASLVLVKALDYNSMAPNFNLTIVAQDNGVPPLLSQATIAIYLIDVDNLDPKFNSPSYNLNISIDTTVGSEVIPNEGRIFAYDQDIGINASILYFLLTSNIYLSINMYTGILTLQSSFDSTTQFDLLIKAQQQDNVNRSVTTVLHVNIYDINLYPPRFLSLPYTLFGYTTNNRDQIPTFNGTVSDMDTTPRLQYGISCNSSLLAPQISKTSLRQFQIQLDNVQTLPVCRPCFCFINVTDGRYSDQTTITVLLYTPASFSMSSYLFSADYPLSVSLSFIGNIQIVTDVRCQVQYSLDDSSSSLFSISQSGNLTWSNPSVPPGQEAYQLRVIINQICAVLTTNISTDVIVTIRNFPSSSQSTTASTSARSDSSTTYAIIASVGGFILVVVAILFVIIYYNIQRAKHRVPPFFKTRQRSPAEGLSFFKSKSPISDSSPYTLGVRDDDGSSGSSDQTASTPRISSPSNNRLLSGHYKVSEPPANTTIEELLSTYDNRSTSSSSSSSGGDQPLPTSTGSFRTTIRESNESGQLDTINEEAQWANNNSQRRIGLRRPPQQPAPEDSMDIISESHESSISGNGTDLGPSTGATSPTTPPLLQQQPNTRNVLSRNLNEYLTVFV